MLAAIKKLYDYMERYQGKKLLSLVLAIFILFLVLGVLIGYIGTKFSNLSQKNTPQNKENLNVTPDPSLRLGKVVYQNPTLYPDDGISYKLVDSSGKDIILLKAADDKLKFIEGATVKLRGRTESTLDGKREVFFVEQIVYN